MWCQMGWSAQLLRLSYLSKSKQNYAQVEKEAFALIFNMQKFHQYLYGRHFILITDNKPLTTTLGPK